MLGSQRIFELGGTRLPAPWAWKMDVSKKKKASLFWNLEIGVNMLRS